MYAAATPLQGKHDLAVAAVKFSPDGRHLATCSADRAVCVWAVGDGKRAARLYGPHHAGVSDVAWSTDSRFVCSASDDRTVVVWEVEAGRPLKVLRGHTSHVMCVAFNRWSNVIASGSFDRSVRLWDVRTGRCIRHLPAHTDPVTAVAFHPRGDRVLSSSFDGLCREWDVETGECRQTLFEDANPAVSHVRLSPNGRFALTSNLDSSLRLWDCRSKQRVKVYRGHQNETHCLATDFAAHGPRPLVVAGSEDGRVCVWDLQTQELLQELQHGARAEDGTAPIVLGVAAHPTERLLATCCNLGTVSLWRAGGKCEEEEEKEEGVLEVEGVVAVGEKRARE